MFFLKIYINRQETIKERLYTCSEPTLGVGIMSRLSKFSILLIIGPIVQMPLGFTVFVIQPLVFGQLVECHWFHSWARQNGTLSLGSNNSVSQHV